MAASTHPNEYFQEMCECPICVESFRDARVLPECGHYFCLQCLQSIADRHPSGFVTCPTCRAITKVKPSALPKSFAISALQQKLAEQQISTTEKKEKSTLHMRCSLCGTGSGNATIYCLQCAKPFCKRCCKKHNSSEHFKSHSMHPLEHLYFCKTHLGSLIDFYCADCHIGVCGTCIISSHEGHKITDIETTAAVRRKRLSEWLTFTQQTPQITTTHVKVIDKTIYNMKQKYENSMLMLTNSLENVKEIVSAIEREIESLRHSRRTTITKMISYRTKCQDYVTQVDLLDARWPWWSHCSKYELCFSAKYDHYLETMTTLETPAPSEIVQPVPLDIISDESKTKLLLALEKTKKTITLDCLNLPAELKEMDGRYGARTMGSRSNKCVFCGRTFTDISGYKNHVDAASC